MRAILLASATAANFGDLRLRSAVSQGDALPPRRTCWITAVAPTTSPLRNPSSPARPITPGLALPAGEWPFGGHAIPAPNARPHRNSPRSRGLVAGSTPPTRPAPGPLG